jgi:3D-(3,5/4)-trihydroxycyclohexane-1,2-dione acylhydrolase (decyclizing)
MLSGAATATINRLPVLLLASDYYATRHQGPVLQQLEHPISADVSVNDCFRPISRFFDRVSRPEQLLSALPEAMRVLTSPVEVGAVTLALPQDVQAHAYDYPIQFFETRSWRVERRLPDPKRISEAAALLKAASRPMIVAGGGVHYSEACDELAAFSEEFGVPVGETHGGKGAIQTRSDLLLGGVGVTGTASAAKIASQADLVISIGARMGDFATGSRSLFQHAEVKFISINVGDQDAHKMGALPIIADAREALGALSAAARAAGVKPDQGYVREIVSARTAWERQLSEEVYQQVPGEAMSQGQLLEVLNEEARDGDVVVAAAGGPPGDVHKVWDCSDGRAAHIEFGYSCMGYELSAGLGVRMKQPDGEVFVFIGDGTYLMNPMEIVTAVQEGLKVTVVVADNHGYQVIRQLQMGRVGHSFGNEFRARDGDVNRLEGEYLSIDFAKNAESMGARSWHVETPDELRQALREARDEAGTCVIVAEVEKHRYLPAAGVWWDVASAEVTGDSTTRELRAQYEKDRDLLQRLYY